MGRDATVNPDENNNYQWQSGPNLFRTLRKYGNEMRLLFQGGNLRNSTGFRNVAWHCISELLASEELGNMLRLSEHDLQKLCSTSGIHDWRKQYERLNQEPPAEAAMFLAKVKTDTDLMSATDPLTIEKIILGRTNYTWLQKLLYYIDMIHDGVTILPTSERIAIVAEKRPPKLSTLDQDTYWEGAQNLCNRIEQEIFDALPENIRPPSAGDIPTLLRERVSARYDFKQVKQSDH